MIQVDDRVDLLPVDITPYRAGNTGIPYATTLDSGVPGPHAMIAALTHGNELCGAHAVDFLFRSGVRPVRGRLTLAFMNYAAYHLFDPASPRVSRYVGEDFNRVWDRAVLEGSRDTVELRRAREVRRLLDTVDSLLDIHSMQAPTDPLALAGPLAKGRDFARRVGYPAHILCDEGHAAGRRMRDYGAFADPDSPRNALLVECGQHWHPDSVAVARRTTLRFLDCLNMLDPAFATRHLDDTPGDQRTIEVTDTITMSGDDFRFARPFVGMEVIERAGTIIGHDGDRPVRTPYDSCVLIMPNRRRKAGDTAVRLGRFV